MGISISNIVSALIERSSKKEIIDINEELFEEVVDENLVWDFIKNNIIKDKSEITLKEINKRITIIDDFNMDFIGVYSNLDNTDIKIVLPKLTNLKSALIYIHELTHYVCLDSRKGIKTDETIMDELISFINEYYFLRMYYTKEHLNNFNIKLQNNVIKYARDIKNKDFDNMNYKIKYIYSFYTLKRYGYLEDCEDIFNKINQSSNNLMNELGKQIVLKNDLFLFSD